MHAQPDLTELETQKDNLVERIMSVVHDMIEVIIVDVPAFIEREVRRRFVEALDFAEGLDESAIKDIHAAIQERSKALEATLRESLGDKSLWMADDVAIADGKSLEPNTGVWTALQAIPQAVQAVLGAFGFPADTSTEEGGETPTYDIVYRAPVYFIRGQYLPGLVEKYWSLWELLHEIEVEVREAQQAQRREALAARWDAVKAG